MKKGKKKKKKDKKVKPQEEFGISFSELGFLRPDNIHLAKFTGETGEIGGVFEGDLLLLDTNVEPKIGDIIVAYFEGKPTIRQYSKMPGGNYCLTSGTPNIAPIIIPKGSGGFKCAGVIVGIIRVFDKHASSLALSALKKTVLSV